MPTLREVRAARLLTVRGLAERAGVAFSTVHLIETGKSAPRFGVIHKLSAALGVEPAEIAEFAAAIAGVAAGFPNPCSDTEVLPMRQTIHIAYR